MKLVIYGNGAMAKVLYSYASRAFEVAGFTVDDNCIGLDNESFCGLPLVPFSRVEARFDPAKHQMVIAVGYIDMNDLRERKYAAAVQKGYAIARYVHESVLLHQDVRIEEGCVIYEHVVIHPGSRIGRNTFIAGNVNIGHDCVMGAGNWINGGVSIAGGCHIGDGCFWGVNASAVQGIRIGSRNFIGANTLISKDTADDEVYVSAPGQRFPMTSRAFLRFSGMSG